MTVDPRLGHKLIQISISGESREENGCECRWMSVICGFPGQGVIEAIGSCSNLFNAERQLVKSLQNEKYLRQSLTGQ